MALQTELELMESASLLNRIKKSSGLSEEQAIKVLSMVADYAKEKFPILEGSIDSFLRKEFRMIRPDLLIKIFGSQ